MKKKIIIGILSLGIIFGCGFGLYGYKINKIKNDEIYLKEKLDNINCKPEINYNNGTFKIVYKSELNSEDLYKIKSYIIKDYKNKYNDRIDDDKIKSNYNIEIISESNDNKEIVNILNGEVNE